MQAGSFGQRQAHANLAGYGRTTDGFLSVSRSDQDGWREQSAYRTDRLSGNAGVQVSDTLELRGFLAYADATLQMPGSLSRACCRKRVLMSGNEWKLPKRYLQPLPKLVMHLFEYRMKQTTRRALEITKLFELRGRCRWSKHMSRFCARHASINHRLLGRCLRTRR